MTRVRLTAIGVVVLAMVGGGPLAFADQTPTPSTPTTPTQTPTPTTPSATPTTTPPTTPTSPPDSPTVSPTPTVPVPTSRPSSLPETTAFGLTFDPPSTATRWEDRPVSFTGRISTRAAGWFISLWQNTASGWVRRGVTRTGTGGYYRVGYTPTWPGRPTLLTAVGPSLQSGLGRSPIRSVTISDRKVILVRPAAVYTAQTGVALAGRVVPAVPGRWVTLDFLYGGRWRGLRSAQANASGWFRIRVPDNYPARWTIRARTVERPSTAVEVSAAVRFEVRAYLNPKVTGVSAADVPRTYRSGCPVTPSQLRRLVLTHWGFDGRLHRGELIVRDRAVDRMISVWSASLAARFPVRQMRRVDVYGGSDVRSMEADNTSVFNCRRVTGDPYSLSPHSYGYAIDINTVENPYQDKYGRWYPSNGLSYRDRSTSRRGMLFGTSTPTRALGAQGYFWGANWRNPDYQHFEPR